MINANELRIGNWVMCAKVDVPFQWQASDFQEIYNTGAKPIPLTPEILEKAGFKKDDDLEFLFGRSLKQINYLHQLQNLYFALTGEELMIKDFEPKGRITI